MNINTKLRTMELREEKRIARICYDGCGRRVAFRNGRYLLRCKICLAKEMERYFRRKAKKT